MIVKEYAEMLNAKSVIREMSAFAAERGKKIGYENVFDYSLGNPSVPVPEKLRTKIAKLALEGNPMEVYGYSPTLGIPAVREKVAASLKKRFGVPYEGKHIFMTSGAAGALAHAFRCVLNKGDEILTFAPYFSEYGPYTKPVADLRVVPADTEKFQINFEAFASMMNEKVAAVLVNSPNNPSGTVYSEETIQKMADFLRKKQEEYGHDIYIISDEPYREILFDGTVVPYIPKYYENTIVCYSFSKSISLPGGRIGYVAVSPACKDAELLINMCGQISRGIGHNCPTSLMQLAVAEILDETSDMSVYEKNMNLLYETLTDLGFTCVKPKGTFYIFPKALEADATAFCKKALNYDLVLVPGDGFGCPGYFRMAYCIDTEKVERSLPVLRKFVEAEYPSR
ncbi:MAG TPA: pyridoxal phosphate-dependent aminotransferase [Candidatus Limivivens intestinipullorum]|uniref:Aminotransferase n=1 Tax=Candidatus Limivivens intestinipullorum TaxID=2840858 RepID=A0A9D1JIP6_9FIRM|nr:pyridoxal phosphate-dependent aminotransferase [Candidatus Limivivens intestinipullorum]